MIFASGKLCAVLIVGAPGSGKGTLGRALGALPKFVHCSCGDVFRSVDTDTKLGRDFLEYSRVGKLMPDEKTIEVWLDYIERMISKAAFSPRNDCLLLDGIPRNHPQAQLMDEIIHVSQVFHLRCSSDSVLVDRIRRRAHKENRPDDADCKVILRRLAIFKSESESLLKHYPLSIIHPIDATYPPHHVLKSILDVITTSDSHRCPQDPVAYL